MPLRGTKTKQGGNSAGRKKYGWHNLDPYIKSTLPYGEMLDTDDTAWVLNDIIETNDGQQPPFIADDQTRMDPGGYGMLETACNRVVQTGDISDASTFALLSNMLWELATSNNRDWVDMPITSVVCVEDSHWVAVKVWWHGDVRFTIEVVDSLKSEKYPKAWKQFDREIAKMKVSVEMRHFYHGAQSRAPQSFASKSGGIYAAIAAYYLLASSDAVIEEIPSDADITMWPDDLIESYRKRLARGESAEAATETIMSLKYGESDPFLYNHPITERVLMKNRKMRSSSSSKRPRSTSAPARPKRFRRG